MTYLTSYEACQLLKTNRTDLKRLTDAGKIRTERFNTSLTRPTVMYLKEDVERLVQDKSDKDRTESEEHEARLQKEIEMVDDLKDL